MLTVGYMADNSIPAICTSIEFTSKMPHILCIRSDEASKPTSFKQFFLR